MYNEQAEPYGLSISAAYILLHIEPEGVQVTQLAPSIGMEPSSITRLLNNIESKGWVERIRKGNVDRRKVMLHLTEEGRRAQALIKHKVKHFNKHVNELISTDKLNTFFEVIDAVNGLISGGKVFEDESPFVYNQFEF